MEKDVKQSSETSAEESVSEDEKTQEQEGEIKEEITPEPVAQETPPKGYVPYAALREERDKRKSLEIELEETKSSFPSDKELKEESPDWDLLSPVEQEMLKKQKKLEKEIASLKEGLVKTSGQLKREEELEKVVQKFPSLSQKKEEFKEFILQDENLNISLEVLAKSFLFEEAETIGARKERDKASRTGLEKATAGNKVLTSPKMSLEEIKRLREGNFKKYIKLVREGKIKEIPKA